MQKQKNVSVAYNGKYGLYLFFTLRRKQFLSVMVVRVMIPKRKDVAIEIIVNSYLSSPKWPIVALQFLMSFCEFTNTLSTPNRNKYGWCLFFIMINVNTKAVPTNDGCKGHDTQKDGCSDRNDGEFISFTTKMANCCIKVSCVIL